MARARIAKGTAIANDDVNGVQTATIASVALAAASTLLVLVANNRGFDPQSVTWNGQALTAAVVREPAGGPDVRIFQLANLTAGTGDVVVTYPGATLPESIAIAALELQGVVTAPLDRTASGAGSSTSPASAASPRTSSRNEILIGAIATQGPSGDAAGSWSNGFTAGQRAGTTGGTASLKTTVAEGFRFVTVPGAYTAAKTGITSRPWAAGVATFKHEPPSEIAVLLAEAPDSKVVHFDNGAGAVYFGYGTVDEDDQDEPPLAGHVIAVTLETAAFPGLAAAATLNVDGTDYRVAQVRQREDALTRVWCARKT